MNKHLIVSPQEVGQRLDIFCASHVPEVSRAAIQKAIKEGGIKVDGSVMKPRYIVKEGQTIDIVLEIKTVEPIEDAPDSLDFPIIFENKDVVVINKPPGISVHPGQGTGVTVVSWLLKRYPNIADVGDHERGETSQRPGIVHRLDKDTSGVLIIAKTQPAFTHLKSQFKRSRAKKEYLALVFGVPGETKGRIVRALARSKRNPLRRTIDPAGKEAITEWTKEKAFGGRYALLRVFPMTGRTHQIRVHMHFLGFPLVGDSLYVFKRQKSPQGVKRHMLHAEKLVIELPNGQRRTFYAELPEDFQEVVNRLDDGV